MKIKYFCFVTILLLASFNASAEPAPIIREDAIDCTLRPWHQLGGCFQNQTGEVIADLQLNYRQSIYYTDKRTKMVALISMQNTHIDHSIVISTSAEVLKKNHIKSILNELVIGRNIEGGMITGCKFEITDNAPVTKIILNKTGENYRCTL